MYQGPIKDSPDFVYAPQLIYSAKLQILLIIVNILLRGQENNNTMIETNNK